MDKSAREERIAQARAEIAKRVERFCRQLPRADFEKLLDRMTGIHCKYDIFPHIPELAEMARERFGSTVDDWLLRDPCARARDLPLLTPV